MAEQEIAKHGKQVIHLLGSKEHSLGHKAREVAIEFVTILFAVLLSIWLHGWSEHRHQQAEVRTFLAGLKNDLQGDIGTLEKMTVAYKGFDDNYRYLATLDPRQATDADKFAAAYAGMDANWFFIPNRSRYDGFLMSGKLANIEHPELLNDILALYQSTLPQLQTSENGWRARQNKLRDYRDDTLAEDSPAASFKMLSTPKARLLLKQMTTTDQHYTRYRQYAQFSRDIIKRIDDYPGMAGGAAH